MKQKVLIIVGGLLIIGLTIFVGFFDERFAGVPPLSLFFRGALVAYFGWLLFVFTFKSPLQLANTS